MMRWISLVFLSLFLSGCKVIAYPLYVILAPTETKVKAEYLGLKGKRIALVVAGQAGIDFTDPYARTDLALLTEQAIGQNVKGAEFADQNEIRNFQRARLDWYSLPMSDIGARFESQRVLYIELIQLTTRETESINLLRGRIWAQISVYDMESNRPDEPVYETNVQITHPEDAPLVYSDSAMFQLRKASFELFAREVAQKFYDHKRPIK